MLEPVLKPPVTVSMAFVKGMLSAVPEPAPLWDAALRLLHIDPELLQAPEARVTADQYIALYRFVHEQLRDEGLGFFSRPMRPGSYALVMRSLITAPTLERAADRLARAYTLLLDDARFECVREGEGEGEDARVALRMMLPAQPTPERAYVHEFMVRVFLHTLVWLSAGTLRARRLDFGCARPAHAHEYATVFPGEVFFGQDCSALWFAREDLAQPVRRDALALRDYLAKAPGHVVLPRRTDRTTLMRVRQHLQRARPHWPDLPAVAEVLHMSVSSLQRRLGAEGTSFQEVRNALRRDIAVVRLTTSAVPLAELAQELGFADNAAFQRAFKAWTGSAPGAYRSRSGARVEAST